MEKRGLVTFTAIAILGAVIALGGAAILYDSDDPNLAPSYIKSTKNISCSSSCGFEGNTQCSGNGIQTCVLNKRGCLVWSSFILDCGLGTECQNGECMQNVTIECNSDNDCPPEVINFCNANGTQACTQTTLFTCQNPGTPQSNCVEIGGGGGCGICQFGCSDGECLPDDSNQTNQTQTHSECFGEMCILMNGSGVNECVINLDCQSNQTSYPDLVISNITVVVSINTNETGNETNQSNAGALVFATISNIGNNVASQSVAEFTVTPLGGSQHIGISSLSPGQSVYRSAFFDDLEWGYYNTIISADIYNNVTESNEQNNVLVKNFTIPQ